MALSNVIGNTGGLTTTISVTPTITASNAYGTNYVIGGLLTFNNAFTVTGSGIIESVCVMMKDAETSGFTFIPFSSNPSNTTWTDAAVAAINAADVFKVLPPVILTANSQLASTVYTCYYAYGLGLAVNTTAVQGVPTTTGTPNGGSNQGVPNPGGTETFTNTTNLPLYGVLLANAALTNNFAGTSDIQVSVTILQDA
jgi:hypothetical protein